MPMGVPVDVLAIAERITRRASRKPPGNHDRGRRSSTNGRDAGPVHIWSRHSGPIRCSNRSARHVSRKGSRAAEEAFRAASTLPTTDGRPGLLRDREETRRGRAVEDAKA